MITLHEIKFPKADLWEAKNDYICKDCIEALPSFFFPGEIEYDLDYGKTISASRCPNCGKENNERSYKCNVNSTKYGLESVENQPTRVVFVRNTKG
jgi:hypothetical protein